MQGVVVIKKKLNPTYIKNTKSLNDNISMVYIYTHVVLFNMLNDYRPFSLTNRTVVISKYTCILYMTEY